MASAEGVGARRLVRKNRKRRVTVSDGTEKTLRPAKSIAADCVRSLRWRGGVERETLMSVSLSVVWDVQICWSGCRDSQLSNETMKDAIVTGAMSNVRLFMNPLTSTPAHFRLFFPHSFTDIFLSWLGACGGTCAEICPVGLHYCSLCQSTPKLQTALARSEAGLGNEILSGAAALEFSPDSESFSCMLIILLRVR